MAINSIQAVLFDMGGTIEDLYYDERIRQDATARLCEFLRGLELDPGLSPPELQSTIAAGIGNYQAWREGSERELPPEEVWTDYIFAKQGIDRERLMAAADDIAFFYETHYYVR
ncbi:MAG: hypothetical protein M8467_05095, partial [Anaerolineae bacterium]|nr:hypothetical protein [Anaerolineae bacterium]